jgi:hypothetical protein
MAFCPNCGTPNTDQAEKCVACGFELIVPKQKAKFKGTIMMSGIKAPTQAERSNQSTTASAPPSAVSTAPAPIARVPAQPPSPAEGGRNMSYQKTMLGPASGFVPPSPAQPSSAQQPAPQARPPQSLHTPTQHGSAAPNPPGEANYDPRAANTPSPYLGPTPGQPELRSRAEAARTSTPQGSGYGGPSNNAIGSAWDSSASGGFASTTTGAGRSPVQPGSPAYESTLPPATPDKPNPGKILAIGCGVALALLVVVGALVNYVIGPKLKAMFSGGDDSSAEAAAWQASISQSLAQVTGLCQVDCSQASVFFHADKQAALLGEARALTPERLQKFGDPKLAQASMLDGTDDAAIATALGLDPQQCARVTAGGAKVISCSVPDVGGKPSVLRIVHMSGISSL